MTTIILLTVLLTLAIITIMAVGVLFGRQPIKGSCGGMSALGMETDCDICGGDTRRCDEENRRTRRAAASRRALFYDAAKGAAHNPPNG